MTNYANVKVRISEGQKDKLKKAFESNCESITIRLSFTDMQSKDVIAITKSQLDRLVTTYEAKKNLKITISSIRGWSIIGTGKYGCSKINWKRFNLKMGCRACQTETDGRGLHLGPTRIK